MNCHIDDSRSKRVVFVANCILNANNKVLEFARYPGMFFEVLETINNYGLGIIQMPCPEVLYMGNQRWWNSRNLYDNVGYRRICREIAKQMIDYMENYKKVNYDVVALLTCDGSPSCGITISSYCEEWGGRPKEIPRKLVEKPGIFMEELMSESKERQVELPPIFGLAMDNRDIPNEKILEDFNKFMQEKFGEKQ
ncbi:DUF523 domain-containing protein [Bacillota bacterium]